MKIISKILFASFFTSISLGQTMAQTVDQIYMKSGSVVEGYISEQKPGKYIAVKTNKATIVVGADSLKSRVVEKINLESLSTEWQQWAEENGKSMVENGIKVIELATLQFPHSQFEKVFLLEKGSVLKFLDLSANTYRFRWGDMYRTVKTKRPDNLFSGVKEVLELTDGSVVEGQIIEQYPGKDLKVLTVSDEIYSYKYSQVKKIKTVPLNDKIDLWSQVQLLDVVELKNQSNPLTGFISSRTLNKELVIELQEGGQRTLPLSQVVSYAKIPNDQFQAVMDTQLNDGEVLLNGSSAYFVSLSVQGQYLLLGETVSAQLGVGETVCLEARLENPDVPITLVKAHMEMIEQTNGRKSSHMTWPVITYQDLVQSHVPVKREVTPLGNVKVTFVVNETGDYVLYIQGKRDYIVINVIQK